MRETIEEIICGILCVWLFILLASGTALCVAGAICVVRMAIGG